MKIWFAVAVMALFGCQKKEVVEISAADRFPPPWTSDVSLPISRALVAKNIQGCGEYKYRESRISRGEYLVYCTRDGSNWVSYLVLGGSGNVTGPHELSAGIPP